MKKIFYLILFTALATFATAQPVCPSGNLTQNAKWSFVFSQCMKDSLYLTYTATSKVAYIDANGVVTSIEWAALLDSLNVSSTGYPAPTPQDYGAVADSITDDYQAFQDAADASGEDFFLYVPAGYYVSSQAIVISGKRRVKIWGEGVMLMQHDTGGVFFINKGDTGDIEISGLKFDFQGRVKNNIAINIYYRAPEKVLIENCEFLNFGDTAQIGIRLERVPTAIRYYGLTTISNCLFMNVRNATYAYYDSTLKGRGIVLTGSNSGVQGSEYGVITGCSFSQIGTAVYWENGSANWVLNNNLFTYCAANTGSDRYAKGILHIATGNSGNKGKINIYGNKFNHNFSIAIFSGVSSNQYRPILIDDNEFISNSAMPIYLQDFGHHITNNFFDRMAELPSIASGTNPWAADTARAYILLDSSENARIQGNTFTGIGDNPAKYAAKTTNSNKTYFQDNIFTGETMGINISDAISYIDTTDNNSRYINNRIVLNLPTLTGSQTFSGLDLNQTWNTSGSPTAIRLNVTNTGSGSASLLMNLRVGGVSQFSVRKDGVVATPGAIITTSGYIASNASGYNFATFGRFNATADGVFMMTNTADNGFNRLMFGGTTSAFPAIKRLGAGIQVRLADDSDFAPLETGTTTINSVLTLTPITATAASALTPTLGMFVVVSNTNGTFTSIGLWFYNGVWTFIA